MARSETAHHSVSLFEVAGLEFALLDLAGDPGEQGPGAYSVWLVADRPR